MILHYLPIIVGVICITLMIVSRLLTNKQVKVNRARIAKEFIQRMKSSEKPEHTLDQLTEASDAIGNFPQAGQIPAIFSVIYVFGFVGLVITFIWAILSVGWLEGVVVASLYFCSGFMPSALKNNT